MILAGSSAEESSRSRLTAEGIGRPFRTERCAADQAAHLSLGCAAARGYGSAEQCERKVVGFIESPSFSIGTVFHLVRTAEAAEGDRDVHPSVSGAQLDS